MYLPPLIKSAMANLTLGLLFLMTVNATIIGKDFLLGQLLYGPQYSHSVEYVCVGCAQTIAHCYYSHSLTGCYCETSVSADSLHILIARLVSYLENGSSSSVAPGLVLVSGSLSEGSLCLLHEPDSGQPFLCEPQSSGET